MFLTYDAGGHDEYQEMHQTFLSHNTLYILVWNVALESDDHQLEEKMASWATLLQTCAPGSRVLLVASHADEVEDPSVIPGRCQRMVTAVRGMLDQHRAEQQRELDRLAVLPATGNEQARKQLLEEVPKKPLQLADRAVVVSAATLEGIPELRQRMLDAAFDKSSFPSFGSNQPNTYLNILRQARKNHGDQLSVTMAETELLLQAGEAIAAVEVTQGHRRLAIRNRSFAALRGRALVEAGELDTASDLVDLRSWYLGDELWHPDLIAVKALVYAHSGWEAGAVHEIDRLESAYASYPRAMESAAEARRLLEEHGR